MDEKGFIFSMDAALMLIPIFIIVAAVSHINLTVPHESPYYTVQDALDSFYYSDVNASVVNNLTIGNKDAAKHAANNLLVLKTFANATYALNYKVDKINNGAETNLINNTGTIDPNARVSSSRRQQGNVTLILYMWK